MYKQISFSLTVLALLLSPTATLSTSLWWQQNELKLGLPPYMQLLKKELSICLDENARVTITVPQKPATFWLKAAHENSHQKIGTLLQTDSFPGYKKTIQRIKKEYPHLKALYESPAYITENHTLEEHTLAVLAQFEEQKKFYSLDEPSYLTISSDMHKLLIAAILVHDIGKPLGARSKQHEYTLPIAQEALTLWGFSKTEIAFALILIDNDIIGELVQPKFNHTPTQAHAALEQLAKKASLPLDAYFFIQMLFFISDASSYWWIRNSSFNQVEKTMQLLPKSEKFWDLWDLLN